MKKIITDLSVAVICISIFAPSIFGSGFGEINKEYPEIYDGVYNGYDLDCPHINDLIHDDTRYCWGLLKDDSGKYYLESYLVPRLINDNTINEKSIRVPDSVNGKEIEYIYGSCELRKFDLNPKNNYMKCVDNVIFSKDGKRLMSYGKFDERTEYTVPEGTEAIEPIAFFDCDNITRIDIPDSVKRIEALSFCNDGLSEISLTSLNVKIDKAAFGAYKKKQVKLNICMQPKVHKTDNILVWDKNSDVSYYEIYQKLSNGEYKFLKTTKATACKFTTLKNGKKYTFAVKPVAVIPAANYDKEKDEGEYPESFTIEGTMSEDIVVIGK